MVTAEDLIGVWNLLETRSADAHGNPGPHPLGPSPAGMVKLTKDRLLAVVADNRVEGLPEGHKQQMVSYGGPFVFDHQNQVLTTKVDMTSDPVGVNGDQVRKVRMEGNKLVLSPPPREINGTTWHFHFVWEKLQ